MGDQYCLIGPYKEASARTEVEEADFPHNSPLHLAVQVLRDQGFKVSLNNNFLATYFKYLIDTAITETEQ